MVIYRAYVSVRMSVEDDNFHAVEAHESFISCDSIGQSVGDLQFKNGKRV